jgi:hypothetical protein
MIKSFQLFQEKYSEISKLDYYYVLEDLSTTRLRDIFKVVNLNKFRAVATFSENIEHFLDLPCKKIALINYPKKYSLNKVFREIENTLADEIELPWDMKYHKEKDQWRSAVLNALSHGKIIRPMLEFGTQTKEEIVECLEFFKEIGIKDIVTSSGLYENTTTLDKMKDMKTLIPNIFRIKVLAGIKDNDKAKLFFKEGVNLVGTTFTKINL